MLGEPVDQTTKTIITIITKTKASDETIPCVHDLPTRLYTRISNFIQICTFENQQTVIVEIRINFIFKHNVLLGSNLSVLLFL